MEKDFPKLPDWLNGTLPDSPKNMGISRADLWAFASLVALDEHMMHTKSICNHRGYNMTCGDESNHCYERLPDSYLDMFKTGRSDCIPSSKANSNQGYLASKMESQPSQGFNGKMTVEYFAKNFNIWVFLKNLKILQKISISAY